MPPWKDLFRQFDRNRSLAGHADDALYCEREEQDPASKLEYLMKAASLNESTRTAFFTGHRGSGKTSSLLRLSQNLTADYFPIYTDVGYHLDTTRTHVLDLLWLLGLTLYSAAQQEKLREVDRSLVDALEKSLYSITKNEDSKSAQQLGWAELIGNIVSVSASLLGSKLGEQLADKLMKPFAISSGIEEKIARSREIEPQVNEVLSQLNLLIAAIQAQAGKPVLLIVDGLDKLPNIEQARAMFLESSALVGLACSVVYTIPLALYTDPAFRQRESEFGAAVVLPNIKLYERDGADHEPGYQFMTRLVDTRLEAIKLKQAQVISDAQLRRLAHASGGVVRDFVGLIHDSFMPAYGGNQPLPLADTHINQAIADTRRALTSRLTQKFKLELQSIRSTRLVTGSEESAELLHGMLALAFCNGETWYDAHPLLWDSLA